MINEENLVRGKAQSLRQGEGGIVFRTPLEDAARYPAPRAPNLPVLSLASFGTRTSAGWRSDFLVPPFHFFRSGRAALAAALRKIVVRGDHVLMPAYHCGSLVEPALWVGADVELYHVAADLRVEQADVLARVTPRTRCLVVVHYFGFPQPMGELVELCADKGIVLVEDCAHALLTPAGGPGIGTLGDVAVASTVKFFPGTGGGILIGLRTGDLEPTKSEGNYIHDLRALYGVVHRAASYGRLGPLGLLVRFVARVRGVLRRRQTSSSQDDPDAADKLRWLVPDDVGREGTSLSRWIVEHSNVDRAATLRRRNFLEFLHRFSRLKKGRPLFAELPNDVVPYVFPLLLDDPARDFPLLKQAGVPLSRWEEVAHSDCPVSGRYLHELVQIPCHQELTSRECEFIADSVALILD